MEAPVVDINNNFLHLQITAKDRYNVSTIELINIFAENIYCRLNMVGCGGGAWLGLGLGLVL